jgi:hypothetical protein
MTISKAQGQTLKRFGIKAPMSVFPKGFLDPLHLITSLLQLLKDIDSVYKMTAW